MYNSVIIIPQNKTKLTEIGQWKGVICLRFLPIAELSYF